MALTVKGRTIQMDAANDVLNWATLQAAVPAGVYKSRIGAIYLVWAAAGTAIVLRNGGTSGVIIFNQAGAVNTTTILSFSAPLEFDDFAVTVLPAGATVVVHLC